MPASPSSARSTLRINDAVAIDLVEVGDRDALANLARTMNAVSWPRKPEHHQTVAKSQRPGLTTNATMYKNGTANNRLSHTQNIARMQYVSPNSVVITNGGWTACRAILGVEFPQSRRGGDERVDAESAAAHLRAVCGARRSNP
jgi:hypothetical protein